MSFIHRVAGLSLRDKGSSSIIWREFVVAPPHQKKSVEGVYGHVPLVGGTGKTQIMYPLVWSRGPPEQAGKCGLGEACLGSSTGPVASTTRLYKGGKRWTGICHEL